MPNKYYVSGRKKEWRVQELLEAEGYLTFRTAGSHTPVDVLAFYDLGDLTRLDILSQLPSPPVWIQVKSKSPISNDEWNILYRAATRCGAVPVLAICLPRKKIQYMQLLGTRKPREQKKPWVEWQP